MISGINEMNNNAFDQSEQTEIRLELREIFGKQYMFMIDSRLNEQFEDFINKLKSNYLFKDLVKNYPIEVVNSIGNTLEKKDLPDVFELNEIDNNYTYKFVEEDRKLKDKKKK